MNLSDELISQFAKLTAGEKETNKENTVYGTVVEFNGTKYVKLDGSDQLTPVTSTTRINNEDRVTVMIKNHTATVTGNISSPSATGAEVDTIGENIKVFDSILADKISTDDLAANNAEIENLYAKKAEMNELVAETAVVGELKAVNMEVEGKFKAVDAEIKDLTASNATITGTLTANEAEIKNLKVKDAEIEQLYAKTADVEKLYAKSADVENLYAKKAEMNELVAETAVVDDLKADVGDINTLMFGSASGNVIQSNFANAVIAQLGNAQIKSAMIDSVSADKITAGDVITNNVRVMSNDGKLLISDETIQISDDTRVRVQIGKDAANDYSINIWDADGNLMFSQGGITDKAIKDAIIRNDMVSDDANISASKLDISSLFKEINDDGAETIKSSKIYLNDKEQTLDVAFTEMTSDVNNLDGKVTSQGTQISAIQGQISSKVWQQDIETTVDNLEIGGRNLLLNSDFADGKNKWSGANATSISVELLNNKKVLKIDPSTGTQLNGYAVQTVSDVELNTKYIFSAKVYVEIDMTVTVSFWYPNPSWVGISGGKKFNLTAGWNYVSASVTSNAMVDKLIVGVACANTAICYLYHPKLEKGNKATDWTPAPEDVDSDIDTLSTQYSELNQTVNSISATVASHTTEIESKADNTTVTAINSKVSELEIDLDGFHTTVSSTYATKTELDDLEIGGRNLALNTGIPITIEGRNINNQALVLYQTSVDFQELKGENIAVSFDYEYSEDTDIESLTRAYLRPTGNPYKSCAEFLPTIDSLSGHYAGISTVSNLQSSTSEIGARFDYFTGSVTISNLKIERGNKVTDWTPAPEDVDGELRTLSTQYSSLDQTVNSISATVAKHTSDISGVSSQMSDMEINLDGFKTTVSETYVTNTEFDNLEIGGRNLLLNSDFSRGTESWGGANATSISTTTIDKKVVLKCDSNTSTSATNGYAYQTVNGVDLSTTYTASAKIYTETDTMVYINAWYSPASGGWVGLGGKNFNATAGWNYISTTITSNAERDNMIVGFGITVPNVGYIYQPKLERGNKVTDWTPAPEDMATANDLTNYATKSEVTQTATGITSQVSATYATKVDLSTTNSNVSKAQSDIDNLEIGGRNLLLNTKTMSSYSKNGVVTTSIDTEGYTVASWSAVDTLSWRGLSVMPPLPFSTVRGKTVTISFDVKTTDPDSYNADTTHGLVITANLCSANSTSRQKYTQDRLYTTELTDSWKRVSITKTLNDAIFTSGTGDITDDTRFYIMIYDYSTYPMDVRKIKMEFGNKATDWTPAPEDVDSTINNLNIGGRNLVLDSEKEVSFKNALKTFDLSEYGTEKAKNRKVTMSFDAYTDEPGAGIDFYLRYIADGSGKAVGTSPINGLTDVYTRYSATINVYDNDLTMFAIRSTTSSTGKTPSTTATIYVKNIKVELGDKATDWTPAPEDVISDIDNAKDEVTTHVNTELTEVKTVVQQLRDSIATLVQDEDGNSLMVQDSTSATWSFSTKSLKDALAELESGLEDTNDSITGVGGINSQLTSLQKDMADMVDHIRFTTYDGRPCIELSEGDDPNKGFKLRITNTEIQFADGTVIPAYISNKKLMIEQAEVKDELQFGGFVWKRREISSTRHNLGLQWKGVSS